MIAGTSIGTGMLGLPIGTAGAGFYPTITSFIVSWIFMVSAAFILLRVKLRHPHGADLLCLMKSSLNPALQGFGSVCYLALLYSLICTYLLAATAWLSLLVKYYFAISLPQLALFAILMSIAMIILRRERLIYLSNQILGMVLIGAFVAIVVSTLTPTQADFIAHADFSAILPSMPIITTAFGFSIIIPALTDYFDYDERALNKAIIIGSLICLSIYIVWIWATFGNIPATGSNSLASLRQAGDNGTGVLALLASLSEIPFINVISKIFAVSAVSTSFIGVSLALIHFMHDKVVTKAQHKNSILIFILVYLPPFIVISLYPRGFVEILNLAGLFVAVLMGMLPCYMLWRQSRKLGFILIATAGFFAYIIGQEVANLIL